MTNPTHMTPNASDVMAGATSTIAEVSTQEIQTYTLHDGVFILKRFYDQLLKHLEGRIHELAHNTDYTAEKLCGKKFWDALDTSEHILAGRYIVIMVANNHLPLIPSQTTSANAKQYRLK